MTITSEDVRRLLESDADTVLVVIEGRTEVISAADVDDEPHRGALQVISRADLLARLGSEAPSDREVEEQAGALDMAVSELGG
jgi:hypothetical protein